jgi:hypothetical protein
VAIVWVIAATFVAFELAAVSATSLVYMFPDVFGTLALSREVTESTTCVLTPRDESPARAEVVAPTTLTGSWLLGVGLGRDAVIRQVTSNPDFLERSESAIQQFAHALGAPVPPLFIPRQSAGANREFVSFVEADARGTAHALAVRYSPRACELYKLGAVWGYSEMVRPSLRGERAVFALEIRHYAQRVGLPEPLWKPMLHPTPSEASGEQVIAQTEELTNSVTSHLMASR